ncbi:MAG TPA: serine/threonine-protein kinase [Labilithrix sp.]|jgi:serine/threonine-protein kinase
MESGQTVAGKYRLNQLLGTGGMAEVWSATNTFTERQLAIKFMNTQVAKTPEAAARFLKEAKVSARVNHPNIIDVNDVGQTEDGQLFLVMELLTGIPLDVALRRQNPPMTSYELALVMIEVASALAAAHKSGIVHRDLKPTNIFLHKVREGVAIPKLLDFGVSKFLEDDVNHALTVAGTVLGSPLYMSPEQARGDSNLDGRTDVFAFGAILFEALCGFRAYDAKNFNALIVKIATTKPKSIDEHAPHVPETLRRVVRACLEVERDKRIGSFEELQGLLRMALPDLEKSGQTLPPPRIAQSVVDPDATNALPVLRAQSDRPPAPVGGDTIRTNAPGSIPPPGSLSQSLPPGAIGPYGSGSSWNTPNTSYASITMKTARPSTVPWIALAAIGAVVFFVVAAGIGFAFRTRTASASSETTSAKLEAPAPAGEVPLARGAGRLVVAASPGSCTLFVDGKDQGTTPLAALELPAGSHTLECRASGGKVKTASVTVPEGSTQRYRFLLDDR